MTSCAGCLHCPGGVVGQLAGRGAPPGRLGSRGSRMGERADCILSTRGTGVNLTVLAASAYASWLLHGDTASELSPIG